VNVLHPSPVFRILIFCYSVSVKIYDIAAQIWYKEEKGVPLPPQRIGALTPSPA